MYRMRYRILYIVKIPRICMMFRMRNTVCIACETQCVKPNHTVGTIACETRCIACETLLITFETYVSHAKHYVSHAKQNYYIGHADTE